MQSDHSVFHRHPVNKGFLIVDEVSVRNPQLVCHSVVQSQVERNSCVGKTFVPPGLLEVHGDGVVLQENRRQVRPSVPHKSKCLLLPLLVVKLADSMLAATISV